MLTLLILDVSTLIGTDAQAIHRLASTAGVTCAFADGETPQIHVFGDTDSINDILPSLKRLGRIAFDGKVTPMEWAAT